MYVFLEIEIISLACVLRQKKIHCRMYDVSYIIFYFWPFDCTYIYYLLIALKFWGFDVRKRIENVRTKCCWVNILRKAIQCTPDYAFWCKLGRYPWLPNLKINDIRYCIWKTWSIQKGFICCQWCLWIPGCLDS